jgi:hypothetical protein
MGYGVYEDPFTAGRWAGYAVPAECDVADCHVKIDRGMGYRCETYQRYDLDLEDEDSPNYDPEYDGEEVEGCNLHFCSAHLDHDIHGDDVVPKPDSLEWRRWQLHHESWAEWREHNPDIVEEIISELCGGDSSKERTLLLGITESDDGPVIGNSMILNADEDLRSWLAAGWTVAEVHMPPFGDPRTDAIVQLVRDQWAELHET